MRRKLDKWGTLQAALVPWKQWRRCSHLCMTLRTNLERSRPSVLGGPTLQSSSRQDAEATRRTLSLSTEQATRQTRWTRKLGPAVRAGGADGWESPQTKQSTQGCSHLPIPRPQRQTWQHWPGPHHPRGDPGHSPNAEGGSRRKAGPPLQEPGSHASALEVKPLTSDTLLSLTEGCSRPRVY